MTEPGLCRRSASFRLTVCYHHIKNSCWKRLNVSLHCRMTVHCKRSLLWKTRVASASLDSRLIIDWEVPEKKKNDFNCHWFRLTLLSNWAVGADYLSCLCDLGTAGTVWARARLTITRRANHGVAIVTIQAVLTGHPSGEV